MTLSFYTNKQGNQWEKDKDDASGCRKFFESDNSLLRKIFLCGLILNAHNKQWLVEKNNVISSNMNERHVF